MTGYFAVITVGVAILSAFCYFKSVMRGKSFNKWLNDFYKHEKNF